MITTTLTHSLKQLSKINMILDTGTIVKKVKVKVMVGNREDDEYLVTMLIKNSIHIEKVLPQISDYHSRYNLNTILKSPPIRGCNIKRGKPE